MKNGYWRRILHVYDEEFVQKVFPSSELPPYLLLMSIRMIFFLFFFDLEMTQGKVLGCGHKELLLHVHAHSGRKLSAVMAEKDSSGSFWVKKAKEQSRHGFYGRTVVSPFM